jgi:molecular chaperone DnaK
MTEIAVGIDLGTSNSCVALARRGKVEVLKNAYGESTTASVVNLAADGSITVGNAAKANVIHDPENTIYSAKRLIGRYYFSEEVKKAQAICSYQMVEGENHSVRIKVREEAFSLPEVGAMVLRELKSIAEARLGGPVSKAVVTVPAYFNDNQRQATKDAARIAGLEVLRILNEPTAAALAYGFGKGLNQRVAVYDLGGGTFDISILEIGSDVFEVLATSGDTFLGGDDFDDRVIDLLADEFAAKHDINLRNDPYALEKLKLAAENAKKALSIDDEARIRIPDVAQSSDGKSLSIERSVGKEEFGALVMDLIQRTFKVCDEALQQAGLIARDVDGVILVGGPTRLSIIREAVSEYFQQEPQANVDPDEVVAMGAAIHAESLTNESSEAFLLDVTPLSLQIGVAGGLTEKIIERNTPVPIEQTRTFTTFKDHQESVSIRVYQGESREAGENELLGQFDFTGFEKGRRGEVEIDVTFEIDTDGIVNVTARDRTTGQEASTRITLSSGLSEGELQSIIDKGVTDRVATERPAEGGAPREPDADDDIVPVERASAPRAAPPSAPLRERKRAPEPDLETDDFEPGMEPDISGPIFSPRAEAPETQVEPANTAVDLDEDLTLDTDDELDSDEPLEFNREAPVDPGITSAPEIELEDDMAIEPDLRAAKSGGEELSEVEAAALDALSEELAPDGGSDADRDGNVLFDASGIDLSGDDPEAS